MAPGMPAMAFGKPSMIPLHAIDGTLSPASDIPGPIVGAPRAIFRPSGYGRRSVITSGKWSDG